MEWLKAILGDALTEDNLVKIKQEIPKHFALKSDFNTRGEEIKDLKGKLDTTNTSLKDITAKAELSDTLKADLAKITGEFDTFKADEAKRKTNATKKESLIVLLKKNFNPDSVKLIADTVDLDGITTTEAGEIVDGQIKMDRLAESMPGLKLVTNVGGDPPADKDTIVPPAPSKETDEQYYARIKKENK